ncbi:MAG: hypothetical protein ISQ09_02110 [Rubripirellula sp.]|nr:hypothetical protein [Rubripirellula sp.]
MHRSLLHVMLAILFVAIIKSWLPPEISRVNPSDRSSDALVDAIKDRIEQATMRDIDAWLFRQQTFVVEIQSQPRATVRVSLQQFDPRAVVAILPGKDLQPGVAGVDDNGNGVTDDRGELGATHSDDRCEAMSAEVAQSMGVRPLVLQRGAFMSVAASDQILPGAQQRIQVVCDSNEQTFSFLIADGTTFVVNDQDGVRIEGDKE